MCSYLNTFSPSFILLYWFWFSLLNRFVYVLANAPQVKWYSFDEQVAGKNLTDELFIENVFLDPHG